MVKRYLLPIICLLLLLLIYRNWFTLGVRVAGDYPINQKSILIEQLSLPFTWTESASEGLGAYNIYTLWSWPITFLNGILAQIGVSFAISERLLLVICLPLLVSLGIWKLGGNYGLSAVARIICLFFYLTNTYVLLLVDGGQMVIAYAYGLFPLCFYLIEKSQEGKIMDFIIAGVITSVLGFFDVRFIYVLGVLLIIKFIHDLINNAHSRVKNLFLWIVIGFMIGSIFFGIHFYWLYPLYLNPLSTSIFSDFTKMSTSPIASFMHSSLMLSPHWYQNVYGKITPLRIEFVLIPILVFLGGLLNRFNKRSLFWLTVVSVGVFLSKGSAEPLGGLYGWAYSYLPGFSLFRDSSKFFFLVALSYGILIGMAVDKLIKVKFIPKANILIPIALLGYLTFLARPVFLGQMTGTFSKPILEQEYKQVANILEEDKNFSRILWLPGLKPLSFYSPTHPAVEASRIYNKRPFVIGTTSTYEAFNFLRESPYMGELLDVFGIGYLSYPYMDYRRDDIHLDNIRYYDIFSDQLSSTLWVKDKLLGKPITLIPTKTHQDRFFIAENLWWVVGSDDIYRESTKSAQSKLSRNALVFVDESPGLLNNIDQFPEAKLVLNDKSAIDLAAAFIGKEDMVSLSRYLKNDPGQDGWWKRDTSDFLWLRDFLHQKYQLDNQDFDFGLGYAIAEGERTFVLEDVPSTGQKMIVARLIKNSKGGVVSFYQNDILIGQVDTLERDPTKVGIKTTGYKEISDRIDEYDQANFNWFEVGSIDSNIPLTIKTQGGINIINALASLPTGKWQDYKNKADNLRNSGKVLTKLQATSIYDDVKVKYIKINPTKYKVIVNGLVQPATLVFSQTYDSNWRMAGQQPVPLYSLLNGFRVDKDGEYIVEFLPQRHLYQGLWVSGGTLIIIIAYLLFRRFRKSL